MKKKIIFTCALALCSSLGALAQIQRSEWTASPRITTDNLLYTLGIGTAVQLIDNDFAESHSWLIPDVQYTANVVQNLEFANGKATIYPQAFGLSHWDWKMRRYSVGYNVGYLSRMFPLGFSAGVDYVQDGYDVLMPEATERTEIVKRMVAPYVTLQIRLLSYENRNYNIVLDMGSAYNYAFHYHDNTINDAKAVNNGFTAIGSISYYNTHSHIKTGIKYEHALYDFYNKDYLHDGVSVFAGSKSSFGSLSGFFTKAF